MKTAKTSYTSLPEIKNDFCSGSLEDIQFGPRNELTLVINRLIWEGDKARTETKPTYVHFGGVRNLKAVQDVFEEKPHQRSELYRIDYAKDFRSKVGHLFVEIAFERIDTSIIVECSNISIMVEEIT